MKIDIRGRVDNLKLSPSQGLRPVFEAIANSIHAIEDRPDAQGKIRISFRRATDQGVLHEDKRKTDPILDFEIQDNGIGFDDQNFESFNTSDSRHKIMRGGKGIGRLLWLRAFTKVAVKSTFAIDGESYLRTFNFTHSESGVEDEKVQLVADEPFETTVKLIGFKAPYQEKCTKSISVLAQRIIEHCLEYLAFDSCPQITLYDATTGEEENLNQIFAADFKTATDKFVVNGNSFQIIHVMSAARTRERHSVHYCAHNRVVTTEALSGRVPNLEQSLYDPERDRQFVYSGYISSPILDQLVVAERTQFAFPTQGDLMSGEDFDFEEAQRHIIEKINGYLSEYTEAVRIKKEDQIWEFVESIAPQYRPLLKHKPHAIDRVAPNLQPEKLDVELYKLNQEYDVELQERYHQILGDRIQMDGFEEHLEQYDEFLEEWNERGISSLAKYITHRKATLDFLKHRLKADENGKYQLEEAIHEVVFPLRSTSADVPAERMNLWILDEAFAYHHYLASDMTFKKAEPIHVDSKKEPDLLIFNKPFAFAEEDGPRYGSVMIVEFKRPMRNDYTEKENPIGQVLEYVDLLRSGKAKDRNGRPINFADTMPIHALIVCDFTEKLLKKAKFAQFKPTADKERLYLFHPDLGVFIEIMSFDAMMDVAERRNKILFEKLGLKSSVAALQMQGS
tara:strand:+ start:270 stop:2303 length:2034 start_codon:yes stop_codon:yes gene_type:complete